MGNHKTNVIGDNNHYYITIKIYRLPVKIFRDLNIYVGGSVVKTYESFAEVAAYVLQVLGV